MEEEFIWKWLHTTSGLYYCSRKGRFKNDKTNLSKKGNFYTSEKMARNAGPYDGGSVDVNKAQVEKYGLERKGGNSWRYSKADASEFELKKFKVIPVGKYEST